MSMSKLNLCLGPVPSAAYSHVDNTHACFHQSANKVNTLIFTYIHDCSVQQMHVCVTGSAPMQALLPNYDIIHHIQMQLITKEPKEFAIVN